MFGTVVYKILSAYVSNILPQKIKKIKLCKQHTSGNVKDLTNIPDLSYCQQKINLDRYNSMAYL